MNRTKSSSLAESIKQTRPFASVDQEAYLSILRTASLLSHSTDQFLKKHGITQPQYNVLRILRGAGSEGLCRNEIGERMVTAVPDVSRMLDRMEKSGWIKRQRGTEDRRQVSSCITPAGLKLLTELNGPLIEQLGGQFKGMAKAQLKQLVETLTEVRKRIS